MGAPHIATWSVGNTVLWCYVAVMMDRIDIESSELKAAEIVEHDDAEELVSKSLKKSVCLEVFWFKKI